MAQIWALGGQFYQYLHQTFESKPYNKFFVNGTKKYGNQGAIINIKIVDETIWYFLMAF
jgi:hypothetical protein